MSCKDYKRIKHHSGSSDFPKQKGTKIKNREQNRKFQLVKVTSEFIKLRTESKIPWQLKRVFLAIATCCTFISKLFEVKSPTFVRLKALHCSSYSNLTKKKKKITSPYRRALGILMLWQEVCSFHIILNPVNCRLLPNKWWPSAHPVYVLPLLLCCIQQSFNCLWARSPCWSTKEINWFSVNINTSQLHYNEIQDKESSRKT